MQNTTVKRNGSIHDADDFEITDRYYTKIESYGMDTLDQLSDNYRSIIEHLGEDPQR